MFCLTVLDDEDNAGLITTGSIVTVSVTVKRRNLGVSCFWFATVVNTMVQRDGCICLIKVKVNTTVH